MSTPHALRRLDRFAEALSRRFGGRIPNRVIAAPIFAGLCLSSAAVAVSVAVSSIQNLQAKKFETVAKWRTAVDSALEAANREVVGHDCSPRFREQLRTIGFRPDGLNEFLFVPKQSILCSVVVASFEPPIDLGVPDISSRATEIWIERELAPLGLMGTRGTIVKQGRFAVVVPDLAVEAPISPWLKSEFVAIGQNSEVFPIAGTARLFASLSAAKTKTGQRTNAFETVTCDGEGTFCIATALDMPTWIMNHLTHLAIGSAILVFAAGLITFCVAEEIRRYFSFDARVVRNLSSESIVVAYQPIYDLAEKRISGVEVLARYRDVDGTIVYPDKFINIALENNKTIELTRLVVEAATHDLNTYWTRDCDLQVNINVFPRDVGTKPLTEICETFTKTANGNLKLAVEVIEYEAMDRLELGAALSKIRDMGIQIFIDDFGTGYSSVENVGLLPVDGIKLDRSFAMAPSDSIIGRMFLKVIELLKTTGKPLVVEGIEDSAKLEMLLDGDLARYAQGYCIGKPLPIGEFMTLVDGFNQPNAKLAA